MIAFPGVDEFIERQSPEVAELLIQLRSLLHDAVPNGTESVKWSYPFYSYCGMICYLRPLKTGVALGMYNGTKLMDEGGLLTGEGTMVRHVVVEFNQKIPEDGIRGLLLEAMILNEVLQEQKRQRKR